MIVPVMFFISAETYALAVNFVPSYRDRADKIGQGVIADGAASRNDVEKAAGEVSEEGSVDDKAVVYEIDNA